MTVDTPERNPRIVESLCREFPDAAAQVPIVLELLDAGVAIPFMARYRKEKIGGIAEERLREIRRRRKELTTLENRRRAVLDDLTAKGEVAEDVRGRIERAKSLVALDELVERLGDADLTPEDKALDEKFGALAAAIEKGEAGLGLEELAAPFVSEEGGVKDVEAAVAVALDALALRISRNPVVRARLRDQYRASARLVSKQVEGGDALKKYETYHDFSQVVKSVPSHRALAILRGRREKALEVAISADRTKALELVQSLLKLAEEHPFREQVLAATEVALDTRLLPPLEKQAFKELKKRADADAVRIFARNLEQLLLFPPAGSVVTMGIEPGVRRGCKIAVVGESGEYLAHASVYPFPPKKKADAAKKTIGDFCRHHKVAFIGLGSGPGCREVERFIREYLREDEGIEAKLVTVNEAGSNSYGTGSVGKEEFPKLDPRVRAAITIARRLQDPLSELVKLEPKSIGVGPYQRDVDQGLLSGVLRDVVECCVNRVGVDVNRASERLLKYVAGVGPKRAKALVAYRAEKGGIKSRAEILEIEGMDETSWTMSAGFLRVGDGENPLDRTSIHPEAYHVVTTMAEKLGVEPSELFANERALAGLDPAGFVTEREKLATVHEIFNELRAPGLDPRGRYEPPSFREDLKTLADLEAGMSLEGVVTNIASFGAFVDIGVDQEGLVHVSELSDEFVEDPSSVVAVGQRVEVRVISVDMERKRLSLSRRTPGAKKPRRADAAKRPGAPGRDPRRTGGRPGEKAGGRPGPGGRRDGGGRKGRGDKGGSRGRGDRRGGGGDRRGGPPRAPRIIEQKAKRPPEPEIDKSLPEDEQYRLKLERLRKKFQSGE